MALHVLLREIFDLLERGVSSHDCPWRTPALVTAPPGPGSPPEARTVVLRAFDAAARRLTIHTDARSGKITTLGSRPEAALHGWDPDSRIQLRLGGRIATAGAEETEAAWQALGAASRETYAVALAPGTVVASPEEARARQTAAQARSVFTVLAFTIEALDYLELAHTGHRRARFIWPAAGALESAWLVP